MPKHGDIRKVVKHYIHDGKVIEKKDYLQFYNVWWEGGLFSEKEGFWKTIEVVDDVIEVKDLAKVKEHGVEYYG
jgi:hypothetical protein